MKIKLDCCDDSVATGAEAETEETVGATSTAAVCGRE
jgi:hypothetical protein